MSDPITDEQLDKWEATPLYDWHGVAVQLIEEVRRLREIAATEKSTVDSDPESDMY